jgi:acyl-CoA reductase-like NAD-dependent aldehyde dehydrogenase
VDSAQSEGATLCEGGTIANVPGRAGYYIRPTFFTDAKPGMEIVEEEVFGPVLTMITYSSEEEALELANASRYGLSAEIWSRDVDTIERMIPRLDVSHVSVNGTGGFGIEVPFGGVKESGFGREGGREAIDQYSRSKTVWVSPG